MSYRDSFVDVYQHCYSVCQSNRISMYMYDDSCRPSSLLSTERRKFEDVDKEGRRRIVGTKESTTADLPFVCNDVGPCSVIKIIWCFLLFDLHMYLWWWKMVVDCVHKLINQFSLNQMIDRSVDWSIGSIGSIDRSIDRSISRMADGCPPPVPNSWIRHWLFLYFDAWTQPIAFHKIIRPNPTHEWTLAMAVSESA